MRWFSSIFESAYERSLHDCQYGFCRFPLDSSTKYLRTPCSSDRGLHTSSTSSTMQPTKTVFSLMPSCAPLLSAFSKGPKRPRKHKDPTNHDWWYPLILGLGTRICEILMFAWSLVPLFWASQEALDGQPGQIALQLRTGDAAKSSIGLDFS